ncbi:MAG: nucleotide exchange factor GrpE [SAR324 cluster bacterium]|nr:nucleotide exchange factor GrpE [SAR324 cluster bacterium]
MLDSNQMDKKEEMKNSSPENLEDQKTVEDEGTVTEAAVEQKIEVEFPESETKKEEQAAAEELEAEDPKKPSSEEKLEQAQAQIKGLQDRILRLNAEFENYKKRMAKENVDKFKYYHTELVKELLPALDSLEHAIEHGKKENATVEAMLEGIQMVYKLNQEALEKFSITTIEAVGKEFDPSFHQAIGTVDSDTVPPNHVVDEFQAGYLLHDRVIRPAMVRVAKKTEVKND